MEWREGAEAYHGTVESVSKVYLVQVVRSTSAIGVTSFHGEKADRAHSYLETQCAYNGSYIPARPVRRVCGHPICKSCPSATSIVQHLHPFLGLVRWSLMEMRHVCRRRAVACRGIVAVKDFVHEHSFVVSCRTARKGSKEKSFVEKRGHFYLRVRLDGPMV